MTTELQLQQAGIEHPPRRGTVSIDDICSRLWHVLGATLQVFALLVPAFGLSGCARTGSQDRATATPRERIVLPTRTNPPLPPEYALLAKHLCDDLFTDPKEAERKHPQAEALSQLQQMALDLDGFTSADEDLTLIAKKLAACAHKANDLLTEAMSLPEPPGFIAEFVTSFAQGLIGDFVSPIARSRELFQSASHGQAILSGMQVEATKAEARQLLLPAIAKKYAGPEIPGEAILTADFDEGLLDGQSDWFSIANRSGYTLHHCTIQVLLLGRGGLTRRNVHYAADWATGHTLYMHYVGGKSADGESPFVQNSVANVDSLEVLLHCDELTSRISYRYQGAEREKDVERFLAPAAISIKYRPFAKGLLWNDERAAICSLAGAEAIPRGALRIIFKRADQSQTRNLEFDGWHAMDLQTVEFPALDWEPTDFTCELKLQGSNYIKSFVGDFKASSSLAPRETND